MPRAETHWQYTVLLITRLSVNIVYDSTIQWRLEQRNWSEFKVHAESQQPRYCLAKQHTFWFLRKVPAEILTAPFPLSRVLF